MYDGRSVFEENLIFLFGQLFRPPFPLFSIFFPLLKPMLKKYRKRAPLRSGCGICAKMKLLLFKKNNIIMKIKNINFSIKYLIIFIINFSLSLYSQDKVLEKYDFKNNEYSLVFFKESKNNQNKISDSLDNFIIYNKEKLIALRNNWVGEKSDEMLTCGYDYNIYIIDKDSILETLNVNIECGHASYGIDNYYFKGNPLKNLKPDKKIFVNGFSTYDLIKARKIYNKIITTKGVYYPWKDYYEWINYDGNAFIQVSFNENLKISTSSIKKEFDNRYTKENQLLQFWGFSENEYSGKLNCSEFFFNKIKNDEFNWADYKISIKNWEKHTNNYIAFIFSEDEKLVKSFKIE
jgi:hypothetical protein